MNKSNQTLIQEILDLTRQLEDKTEQAIGQHQPMLVVLEPSGCGGVRV